MNLSNEGSVHGDDAIRLHDQRRSDGVVGEADAAVCCAAAHFRAVGRQPAEFFVLDQPGGCDDFAAEQKALSAEARQHEVEILRHGSSYSLFAIGHSAARRCGRFVDVGEAFRLHVLVNAEGVIGKHVLAHPLEGFLRTHAPVGRTGRHHFDEGVADAFELILEGFTDGFFGLAHVGGLVDGDAFDVCHAVELAQHFRNADGEACGMDVSAVGGRLGNLVRKAGEAIWPPVMP